MKASLYKQLDAKINLKHLLCAVAAADLGSFRKAAEALNIQQSSLSRSIDQLEHATSIKLFKRSTGGILVTTLGADFIRIARNVLDQINDFGSSVASSQKQLLRIGFCTSLSAGGLRSSLLDFHHRCPKFKVRMLERRRSKLSLKLQNGTLDLVICTGKLPIDCRIGPLWSERVMIALPEDHPLADRHEIYWTDLRSETLLMSQYDPYWEFEDLITAKLVLPEDRPTIEHHDVSRSILKSLISMKLGIALVLESDVGVKVPSIVFKELRDGTGSTRVQFAAFWQETNDNPALANFLLLLKDRYPSPS
jgi:DNA-binding transcriptional LysR family regulator